MTPEAFSKRLAVGWSSVGAAWRSNIDSWYSGRVVKGMGKSWVQSSDTGRSRLQFVARVVVDPYIPLLSTRASCEARATGSQTDKVFGW